MKTDPTISVVVPVYNVEKYVGACIESILAQTYKDFELILINDGSVDNSLIICQDYAEVDNRIKIISQSNSGVSVARNTGINAANGKWITFVDSDDWIDFDFLSTLTQEISCVECDLITSGVSYKYPDGLETVERLRESGFYDFNVEREFLFFATQELITSPCAKLYKTNLIKNNNHSFDQTLSYGEDRDFNIKYLKYCHRGIISSYVGYNYRKGLSQSLSTIKKGNLLKGNIDYWNNLLAEFENRGYIGSDVKKYLAHRLFFFISDALSETMFTKDQLQYLEGNVNWIFLKNNCGHIDYNKIGKYLIVHKNFKLYRTFISLK